MVFELLKVEVCFVPDRYAVSYHIRAFCCAVAGFNDVVRDIDGFVVAPFDHFSVESERWECDFEADDVAFAKGRVGRHEILGPGHVDLLSSDVAEAIAVCVKADGRVETGLAARPAYADVAATLFLVAWGLVGRLDSAEDLAFPVPAAFAHTDICADHAKALFRRDTAPRKVEQDVGGGIFEVETGAEGFRF